ncbi:MAG: site-specific integrase [Chloroflexi bacterium]|nr:site-specific integrase [Chloroflexota bacterium]
MVKRRGNNEGSLFKRPDGTWRAQVTIEGRRLSVSAKTRKECQGWLKETLKQVETGLTYQGANTNLGEFLSEWHISMQSSLRPTTWYQYGQIIRDHIIPMLGKIKLKDFRPEQIQALYNKKVRDGIGLRTIQITHSVLHRALNHGVKLGLLSRNPSDATNPPKPQQNELLILDENQAQQFILNAEAWNDRYATLYHLAITTGFRQSEILGLQWKDIDWERRTLQVQRQLKWKKGGGFYFAQPKTKSGKRIIVLGKTAIEKLRQHRDRQFEKRQIAGDKWQEMDLIFPSTVGTPINQSNMNKSFKKLLKQSGLPIIRFHDLRHTAASLMLNFGIPLIIVSRRLGHSRPSITLDIYGHLIPSKQEEAAELMDSLLTPIEVQLPT